MSGFVLFVGDLGRAGLIHLVLSGGAGLVTFWSAVWRNRRKAAADRADPWAVTETMYRGRARIVLALQGMALALLMARLPMSMPALAMLDAIYLMHASLAHDAHKRRERGDC